MKRFIIIVTVVCSCTAYLQAQTSLTLSAGLATPNTAINDIYNSNKITGTGNVYDLLLESASIGYNINARLRFPLGKKLFFSGGVGFSRFPQSNILIKDPATDSTLLTLQSVQNIIPISAGIDLFLFKSIVSPYLGGDLQYNYISNTVDYPVNVVGVPLNLDKAPTDNRVGASVGGGLMIDLAVLSLNVDARYNIANFIGKTAQEKSKEYLTLTVGVSFGM